MVWRICKDTPEGFEQKEKSNWREQLASKRAGSFRDMTSRLSRDGRRGLPGSPPLAGVGGALLSPSTSSIRKTRMGVVNRKRI